MIWTVGFALIALIAIGYSMASEMHVRTLDDLHANARMEIMNLEYRVNRQEVEIFTLGMKASENKALRAEVSELNAQKYHAEGPERARKTVAATRSSAIQRMAERRHA